MTNFEYWKDKLKEIAHRGTGIAVVDNYPAECGEVRCEQCDFYNREEGLYECGNMIDWMLAEHQEGLKEC